MPQNIGTFMQIAQGYGPAAPGIPTSQTFGFEGAPFMSGGGLPSAMFSMFAAPQLQGMMQQRGYIPLGMMGQNAYDANRKIQFTQMQQRLMADAARMDAANYQRTIEGSFQLINGPGQGLSADQQAVAQRLGIGASMMTPMLVQMGQGGLVDSLGGEAGSTLVMAHRMLDQTRYRTDAVTGRTGMSEDSIRGLVGSMHESLFAGGTRSLHGLSQGEVGEMFAEMQSRGLVSGAGAAGGRRGALRSMNADMLAAAGRRVGVDVSRGAEGLSTSDIGKLMGDSEISGSVRAFDATQARTSMERMAGAVKAMGEIFGDAGHPNAPMEQIMDALEAMTQGQLGKMDPSRVQRLVRETYNAAKSAGVSLSGMAVMSADMATRASALGLDQSAVNEATRAALHAMASSKGGGFGSTGAFGVFNDTEAGQFAGAMNLQAAKSSAVHSLGIIAEMSDRFGGFASDSDAGRMAAAMRAGQSTYTDSTGRTQSLAVSPDQLRAALVGSRDARGNRTGITVDQIEDALARPEQYTETIRKWELATVGQRLQAEEVSNFMKGQAGDAFTSSLAGAGMSREAAMRSGRAVAGGVLDDLQKEAQTVRNDAKARSEAMASSLDRRLREADPASYEKMMAGLTAEEKHNKLLGMAGSLFGAADSSIKTGQFANHGGALNVFNLAGIQEGAAVKQAESRADRVIQDAMSKLPSGGALSRAIEAMRKADPNVDDDSVVGDIIMEAMGGQSRKNISDVLKDPVRQFHAESRQYKDLARQAATERDPEKRRKLEEAMAAKQGVIDSRLASMAKIAESVGADLPEPDKGLLGESGGWFGDKWAGQVFDSIFGTSKDAGEAGGRQMAKATADTRFGPSEGGSIANEIGAAIKEAMSAGRGQPQQVVGTLKVDFVGGTANLQGTIQHNAASGVG